MSEQFNSGEFDTELSKIKNHILALKKIDFELAYLALLTYYGIKPLSRWEKPLTNNGLDLLQKINLLTRQIQRTVKSNKEVTETIFSRSIAYIKLYEQRFGNTSIDKSIETQRFEGFLFGYPPCCIEQYIRKPYSANNLEEKDRKILFHWACKNCLITASMLKAYKDVYNQLKE